MKALNKSVSLLMAVILMVGIVSGCASQDNKTELYFQIYKDRSILNPSLWLAQ